MNIERRALVVGIDTYANAPHLSSCVADAEAVGEMLELNADRSPNYVCRILLDKMEDGQPITRAALRGACEELFANFKGDLLLYFSGHGVVTPFGGHLCAFDSKRGDWGIPMQEIVELAINSEARDIIMILDCCHSGDIADPTILNAKRGGDPLAVLRENMTVIAASLKAQPSVEAGGHGLFTASLIDALDGGAADHMGWVTASAIYAYVERRFGSWAERQRPVYKSYATSVRVVRECAPLIDRLKLRRLVELFPTQDFQYRLTPAHEPEDERGRVRKPVDKEKVAVARLFKEYRDAGLLKPSTPGEQLFWTARRRHTVELTLRGREYWWLVKNKKI
ncbi:MAG: caspase family protein [Acidobacteriota bacterium]|nr:caspase family protein [Acidobacteriota bacterium]